LGNKERHSDADSWSSENTQKTTKIEVKSKRNLERSTAATADCPTTGGFIRAPADNFTGQETLLRRGTTNETLVHISLACVAWHWLGDAAFASGRSNWTCVGSKHSCSTA